MEIDFFTLCDFAQEVGGKLTIVGTFDIIYSTAVPTVRPTCHIVARIRFNKEEGGKHSFDITILDDKGENLVPPLKAELESSVKPDEDWNTATLLIGIGQLTFPSFGRYSVNLFVDDKLVKSLTFSVKKKVEKV